MKTTFNGMQRNVRRRWRALDVLGAFGLERRRTTSRKVIGASALILAGAAIGAGVAVLFAPESGRELREDIGRKAHDLREKVMRRRPVEQNPLSQVA